MGISAFSRTVFCSIKSSFYNVKFFFTNKANFIHKVSFVGLLIITVSALTCQVSSADQWDKSRPDSTDAKIDWPAASVANNDALDRGLSNYREGLVLTYSSATTISATPGEIVVSNAAGSLRLMLANTASTNITFSDLDTGAEAASTTYYVYAVAASGAAEVATFKISLSSAAPGSETYYKKIGSFYNDASSNIDIAQIVNDNVDSNVRDVRDFSTSGSSYTVKDIGDLKIAYGTLTVSGTSAALTNLPFSSASSYSITGTFGTANTPTEAVTIVPSSGSAATVYSSDNLSQAIRWFAIGT